MHDRVCEKPSESTWKERCSHTVRKNKHCNRNNLMTMSNCRYKWAWILSFVTKGNFFFTKCSTVILQVMEICLCTGPAPKSQLDNVQIDQRFLHWTCLQVGAPENTPSDKQLRRTWRTTQKMASHCAIALTLHVLLFGDPLCNTLCAESFPVEWKYPLTRAQLWTWNNEKRLWRWSIVRGMDLDLASQPFH